MENMKLLRKMKNDDKCLLYIKYLNCILIYIRFHLIHKIEMIMQLLLVMVLLRHTWIHIVESCSFRSELA